MRLRVDNTKAYVEYSNNNGTSFTILSSVDRPAGTLRAKLGWSGNQFRTWDLRSFK